MTIDSERLIDSRVTMRNKHSFEVKLDIHLNPETKSNKYKIETFFFIPKGLKINKKTYSKTKFYNDVTSYIRLKTPIMSLQGLLDKNNEDSPLNRIGQLLTKLSHHSQCGNSIKTLIYELKILISILRSNMRDEIDYFIKNLEKTQEDKVLRETIATKTCNLLKNIKDFKIKLEEIRNTVTSAYFDEKVRDSVAFAEEYSSLIIEKNLMDFLIVLEKERHLKKLKKEIATVIKQEYSFRKKRNYQSVLDNISENAKYLYRRNIFKKYFASVLYLNTTPRAIKHRCQDVFFAIAAGSAMVVALLYMIYAQNRYLSNTFAFVMVGALGYIVKDRMKDWLKLYFNNVMTRWVPDKSHKVEDPNSGIVLAHCKEAFAFLPKNKVPESVLKARKLDAVTSIEHEGKPEEIMKYEKKITLSTQAMQKAHNRSRSINDIIRFNVHNFLTCTDGSHEYRHYIDPKLDKPIKVKCAREYHINLIMRLLHKKGKHYEEDTTRRVRVIIDENGIKRVEERVNGKNNSKN